MTRFGWLIVLIILIVLGGGTAAYVFIFHTSSTPAPVQVSQEPVIDPSSLSIYTNGTYGFSFFYPADATLTDSYSSTSDPLPWRSQAIATGTLVARIETSEGEVRVGASTAKKETASCIKPSAAEKMRAPVAIASTTWNVFSFDRLGTENEIHITSYRAIHNGACIALESFESSPIAASSSPSAPESVIRSFNFAS